MVINVNLYEFAPIFEIARVSYLLANKKAVIAYKDADTFIEPDIESVVKFTDPERLVADCFGLVQHDELRNATEQRGYEMFRRRDIRDILTLALAAV